MSRIKQFAVVMGAAALLAASTFAEQRPRNESDQWRGRRGDGGRIERRNLSAQGRVTNVHRERDGYRVQLDRHSQWYYVPANAWRSNRGRNLDLRVGVSIRLGGGYYDNRGYIHCSDAWIDDYGYRDGLLSGTVRRIDYRRDVLELRDERSGRIVTVDLRSAERRGRHSRGIDVNDLRRGDYVELEGQWVRGNVFAAYRIDSVDSRRW